MPYVSISLQGNRNYKDAINILARRKGVSMGDIVREALDQVHGDELKEIEALFFAQSETRMSHMEQSGEK